MVCSQFLSLLAHMQLTLTWRWHAEEEQPVCTCALLPLVPQITQCIPLVVLGVEGQQRTTGRSSDSSCWQCSCEVKVIVCSKTLPEVINPVQLHECLPASCGVHLVDPELQLCSCHRVEGGSIKLRLYSSSQGRTEMHPFRGTGMGSVSYH